MTSQYFFGGMMPELANPVQQRVTVVEIRLFKGGWQCYEGPGVQPYWTGERQKRTQSVTPKRARNLDAVKFACSTTVAKSNKSSGTRK
jgi:hypothetical protein